MNKSKIIIIIVLVLGAGIVAYFSFSANNESPYQWISTERKDITQKVSATGQVTSAKELNLQFETGGNIKVVAVETGKRVDAGQVLARLETEQSVSAVEEARASRDVAKAKLDKLMAGASKEEIKLQETAVKNKKIALENARISLENAKQNLEDTRQKMENNLDQVYENALNVLDNSYIKVYNAYETVDKLERNYFYKSDQEGIKVRDAIKYDIEKPMQSAEETLNKAKRTHNNEDIDAALSEIESLLEDSFDAVGLIRKMCSDSLYRGRVPTAKKDALDGHKSKINSALSNVISSKQSISSAKINKQIKINAAKAEVDSAENKVRTAKGNLQSAKDKLEKIKASPREESRALRQAQLEQAKAALSQARNKLDNTKITAPCKGVITDVHKEEGEVVTVGGGAPVASMDCQGDFDIEVEIPEVDIGKVKEGDPVEVSLDAFSDKTFSGKVVRIDPRETMIEGVVYYKVEVILEEVEKQIKPGMTADVDIITQEKKNALTVPQRAVLIRDGKKIVRVLEGEKIKETEVETGIKGAKGQVEILSGIEEGDKVITFIEGSSEK